MFESWSTIKKLIWLKFTILAAKVESVAKVDSAVVDESRTG